MICATHSLEETIERMLGLPVELRLRGAVSLVQLAEATGWRQYQAAIDVATLRRAIRGRQGVIDAWLLYSAGKQADWGWFFEGPDEGVYLLGPRRHSIEGPRQLTDPEEACAQFIRAEFDSLLAAPAGRF